MLSGSHVSLDGLFFLEPLDPGGALVGDWALAPPPPWPPLLFVTLELQRCILPSVFTSSDRSYISDRYFRANMLQSFSPLGSFTGGWALVPPTPAPPHCLSDEFFGHLACCRACGRAIWEQHGNSCRNLARRVCMLQGFVLVLEHVTSRFARPIAAECTLHGSDCKVCLS